MLMPVDTAVEKPPCESVWMIWTGGLETLEAAVEPWYAVMVS